MGRASADELPEILPIFPLSGAMLLPHGRLPLNIFEPRYLSMVRAALAAERMIGMIQPRASDQETAGDGAALYATGCVGRITDFSETEDGRYVIVLSGLCRFEIAEELEMLDGYRRVRPDYHRYLDDRAEPAVDLADRERLIVALKRFLAARDLATDWQTADSASDPVLINSVAMACPFAPEEKQALLEAPDLNQRAERLMVLFEMDSHGIEGRGALH